MDFIKFEYNYNLLKLNIIFENTSFWKILYYFNNNNNNILIFFIIFIYCINNFKNNKIILLILFILILNYSYNEQIFIILNKNNNTSLINGLLIIHPVFIYLTYILMYSMIFFKNIKFQNFKKQTNILIYVVVYCSIFSIFLGSYWAQQELNWGGWWNWDYVELIALVFFCILLFIIHNKNNFIYVYFFSLKYNYILYIFLFYIIVRCDILNSVHSFNSIKILEKYIEYLYISISVVIFICLNKGYFLNKIIKYVSTHKININNVILIFNQVFMFIIFYNLLKFYILFSQVSLINIVLNFLINFIFLIYFFNFYKTKINIIMILISALIFSTNILLCFIYAHVVYIVFKENLKFKTQVLKNLHLCVVLLMLVILNNHNTVFIKTNFSEYINYNYFFQNSNNIINFDFFFKNTLNINNNWINSVGFYNSEINWSSLIYDLSNNNVIYKNDLVMYKIDNTFIFIKLQNINIMFLLTIIFIIVILLFKRNFYKSGIV